MILTTHGIVGAACGLFFDGPTAVALAFASHFALDAIPHWDYALSSRMVAWDGAPAHKMSELLVSRSFWTDCLKIGGDMVFGLGVVALLTHGNGLALTCAAAAMFPDFLQFAHSRFPRSFLSYLQRFHMWIHAERRIHHNVWGPALQIFLCCGVIAFMSRYIW